MILLCMHLYHGLWSMFQSVGISHPRYTPLIKKGAAAVSDSDRDRELFNSHCGAGWSIDVLRKASSGKSMELDSKMSGPAPSGDALGTATASA